MRYPVAAMLAAFVASSEAAAQPRWGLRLGVERAFGYAWSSVTTSSSSTVGTVTTTREETVQWNSLNVFGTSAATQPASLYRLTPVPPRIVVDYEFPSRITLGTAAFASYNLISTDGGDDDVKVVTFGLAPRIGYSLLLGDRFVLWPRVGATFAYINQDTSRSASSDLTALWINVEPTLVYVPTSHLGLTTTLLVDIPLLGDATTTSTVMAGGAAVTSVRSSTLKQLTIGLQFGVQARF